MADAVTMLVQGVIVLAVAILMGATVQTGWLGALELLGLATLFGVVWASLSNLIALRTRNSELTMVAGLLLTLPALFLSPAFFPKPLQPGWLQSVAGWNPAAYVIETGQRLMTAGNDWGLDLQTLAWWPAPGPCWSPPRSPRSERPPAEPSATTREYDNGDQTQGRLPHLADGLVPVKSRAHRASRTPSVDLATADIHRGLHGKTLVARDPRSGQRW